MRRTIIALLVIAALVVGGGLIATTAYNAGVAANVTVVQSGTDGTTGAAVTPVVVPAYGWGWGWHGFWPGFGLFGFLGFLLFLFLIFGLIRFAFGWGRWGRGSGRGGWSGGYGPGGPTDQAAVGRNPWEVRAHQAFDEWHRAAHAPAVAVPEPRADESR